jgi:hypothetical protein
MKLSCDKLGNKEYDFSRKEHLDFLIKNIEIGK